MKIVVTANGLRDGTEVPAVCNATLVIERRRISAITTQDTIVQSSSGQVETIEVAGGTIMPGFVEAHSHIHCSS